jgi:hypothetical protein
LLNILCALRAMSTREILKFVQQRGRLLSALVRPLMWLAVFAAGFYNVFGVSIIPPYIEVSAHICQLSAQWYRQPDPQTVLGLGRFAANNGEPI